MGAFISTLVIAALGSGASLLIWRALESQQATELERGASVVATALAHVIDTRIDEQDLGALRRWSWATLPAADPREWQEKAEFFLADHPSFNAIGRIEGGRIVDVAASGDGREVLRSLEPRISELLLPPDAPGLASEASVGPIRLPDGRVVLAIRVAAPSSVADAPMVFAVFVPEVALTRALERRAPGYAIRVLCGTEDVFRSPEAEDDAGAGPAWSLESLRLGVGPEWSVMVRAALVPGDPRLKAPWVALVAGLLISALIASLVHVSQISRTRAEELAHANADLHDRIDTAVRDRGEIRSLNEGLEARVAERTAVLQETISELETFNYSVSHDLRTPLSAILNFTAIISQDFGASLDAQLRDYLQRITASATDVVAMMDGLLAFSRSGREEICRTRVDVRRLVEGVRDEQWAAGAANGGTLLIGELPIAYADAGMLRLIFANLISNACKFVRDGEPPHVEIGGRIEGASVVYFVRDEGVGFDMRFAEKLFGVFERLHSSEKYAGQGVGLAIVERLVRRHGGSVWAEGAPGKGATFYIRLPLRGEGDQSPGAFDV